MKNWNELEKSSFFDANARERAIGLCDKCTFTELLGPQDRFESPHLTTERTAAFIPGASPPLVNTPMFLIFIIVLHSAAPASAQTVKFLS